MKLSVILLALLPLVSLDPAQAGWVADDDVKDDGSSSSQHYFPPDQHFAGSASAAYNETYATQYGHPWLCPNYDAFNHRAEALDTLWTKRWNWEGQGEIPADESCMDVTIKMTWYIWANCNNDAPTAAMAKTYAHSESVINSAPDNAGDYTAEGEWSGQKREGDTFSGGLSLNWNTKGLGGGISLSWSPDPTDVWQSGQTTKSKRYLQNIKNKPGGDAYEYIYVQIGLTSEVESAADTNAYWAASMTKCQIDDFDLPMPG